MENVGDELSLYAVRYLRQLDIGQGILVAKVLFVVKRKLFYNLLRKFLEKSSWGHCSCIPVKIYIIL